jgi:hypothetical protein
MATIAAKCPDCSADLEFPSGVESISCAACGNPYDVVAFKGVMALIPSGSGATSNFAGKYDADLMIALDDTIAEVGSEIEALKSRELGAPLELGCALFGTFCLAIVVLAVFSTVARRFFGGWIFYSACWPSSFWD